MQTFTYFPDLYLLVYKEEHQLLCDYSLEFNILGIYENINFIKAFYLRKY